LEPSFLENYPLPKKSIFDVDIESESSSEEEIVDEIISPLKIDAISNE
jgi:hypothetical protein